MSDARQPPPAGWHPDPWFTGQHRWWDGAVWTGDTFPDGPVGQRVHEREPWVRPPFQPPTAFSSTPPPVPQWGSLSRAPTVEPGVPYAAPTDPPRPRMSRRAVSIIALVVGLVIGFVAVNSLWSGSPSSTSGAATTPPQAAPAVEPSAAVLQGLVVRQTDVAAGQTVHLLTGGSLLTSATLDICNGTFASEALRTARLQVVDVDASGNTLLSTEAVLYRSSAATAQAFKELTATAASCPAGPVVSPVGEPTVTTTFGAAPDGSWPHVQGVQRLAFTLSTTDSLGVKDQSVAVYLRRGRVLEGLYFPQSGSSPSVQGASATAQIVAIFEKRIAALDPAAVGG